jgi:hypothetical protein
LSNTKEILLSVQEIKQVESFVLQNPQLADPNSLNIANGKCSIAKVSPITGLILVWGNNFTGFTHIHERHDFFSISPYWIEVIDNDGNTNIKLQDQSRFRPDSIPFWDYISIADSLYKPENINVEKNKRPEDFDLYFGHYVNNENKSELYNLLVYKNSKIIHSLYPQSGRNNKKRISNFNFTRGVTRGLQNYNEGIVEITIPYLNSENTVKYSLLIKKYLGQKIEESLVIIHDPNGVPEGFVSVAERRFNKFKSLHHEIFTFQHADLRGLEDWIKRINKQMLGL